MGLFLNEFVFILKKKENIKQRTAQSTCRVQLRKLVSKPRTCFCNMEISPLCKKLNYPVKSLTKANCRPMFPIVITPAKKIQGNHERMYRKSGEVYLCRRETGYCSLELLTLQIQFCLSAVGGRYQPEKNPEASTNPNFM